MLFADRRDAGRRLAGQVAERRASLGPDPIVLALPRGGVPVGFEVARAIGAPLDVFVVRKLGVPGHEELAMGAIATGDVVVLSRELIAQLQISETAVSRSVERERRELERREREYRIGPPPRIAGRGVILVDDGLATGASMLAAVGAVERLRPVRVTIAVPVASPDGCRELGEAVDVIVCAETPEPFYGVGLWYEDFAQTSDDEVRALLRAARGEPAPAEAP